MKDFIFLLTGFALGGAWAIITMHLMQHQK